MTLEFLLIVLGALSLGGFIKGAIGLGLPIVSIPALAAFLGVPHALAIMTVPLVLTNAWQAWRFRHHWSGTGFLLRLLPAGIVGIGFGTWALTAVPVQALSLALAAMIVFYIGVSIANPGLRIPPAKGVSYSPAVGFVAGALQGATGIAAPVSVTFIHALRLERHQFIFAVSIMFLLFTLMQFVALSMAGIMTWSRFLEGWLALVPVALGMPLGARAALLLKRQTFERLIVALLAIMAVRLLQTGLGW